jgi:Cu(I)/Ag(I) efflux system membrane fusion protein
LNFNDTVMKKLQLAGYIGFLITGVLVGALVFGGGHCSAGVDPHAGHAHAEGGEDGEAVVWTCSMHPQIRNAGPGKCPLCAMDLIPAASGGSGDPFTMTMTQEAVRLAQIRTAAATMMVPEHEIYVPGRVVADETRLTRITAHAGGRIISQQVAFVGAEVSAGDVLAVVWSPDLITAQQELLDAARMSQNSDLPEYRAMKTAAREKLRYWGLTPGQIDDVESRGEIRREMELLAPHTGIVTARNVRVQDYIAPGDVLYEITDLSRVWMEFEAFEQDLPWMRTGHLVRSTTPARPGQIYAGRLSWIDPVVDPSRRTVRLRIETDNRDRTWRPDMLLQGTVRATSAGEATALVVPATAVLWTGPRSLLFVAVPDEDVPTFEAREVLVGARAGDYRIILEGLLPGEQVVVNGAFKIDAEFQLRDKVSMMNREPRGTGSSPGGHSHGQASAGITATTSAGMAATTSAGMAASSTMASAAAMSTTSATSSASATQPAFSTGVSAGFRTALSRTLDPYLSAKDALVKSDVEEGDR